MLEIVQWSTLGLNIIIVIVSIAGFLKIIKNDLTHVQKSIEDMQKNITMIWNKVDKTAEDLAEIKGKVDLIEKEFKR